MASFNLNDLSFILQQIKISEAFSKRTLLDGTPFTGTPEELMRILVPDPLLPWGLRTVDGTFNNIIEGRQTYGSADQPFPELVPPNYPTGTPDTNFDINGPFAPGGTGQSANYTYVDHDNASLTPPVPGNVVDTAPRTISNLIVDQTLNNPAAIMAALDYAGITGSAATAARNAIMVDFANLNSAIALAALNPFLAPLAASFQVKAIGDQQAAGDAFTDAVTTAAAYGNAIALTNTLSGAFNSALLSSQALIGALVENTIFTPGDESLLDTAIADANAARVAAEAVRNALASAPNELAADRAALNDFLSDALSLHSQLVALQNELSVNDTISSPQADAIAAAFQLADENFDSIPGVVSVLTTSLPIAQLAVTRAQNVVNEQNDLYNRLANNSIELSDEGSIVLPNLAPDEGISAPFNSWMTLFGQFFDHGLDLVEKTATTKVYVPLLEDDPLYVEGGHSNFMVITRTTADARNVTTPLVDQNQTYTSHASHQVFLREYKKVADGGDSNTNPDVIATGHLLETNGGLATWFDVKKQAADMLGIQLVDTDVGNVPLLATDEYGRFIRGPQGYAQVVVRTSNGGDGRPDTDDDVTVLIEAGPINSGDPVPTLAQIAARTGVGGATVVRTGHAFLDDIAHNAVPGTLFDPDTNPLNNNDQVVQADSDGAPGNAIATDYRGRKVAYDNELLDRHFITGDGRGNENIGLTTVHHVFHSEHNRLAEQAKEVVLASGNLATLNEWILNGPLSEFPDTQPEIDALQWNGERIFQAARFGTEMQYQHLVFEEFARKVNPNVDLFVFNPTMDINPAIFAEFAHTVYRFGHSMLTETVDRLGANGQTSDDIGLIEAFLNPVEFNRLNGGSVSADVAAGAIVRGMTRQVGQEIDEFIVEALRNNLLGLPLDLATVNIARGRETGVPTLQEARAQFYEETRSEWLKPYTSWTDFAQHLKNPTSVINFIAAYGTHASLTAPAVDTMAEKRAAATLLVLGDGGDAGDVTINGTKYTDRLDFLNGKGAYAAGTLGGLNSIDLWIGGLAEAILPFGGMLGSTFTFVFEKQMEMLQNGDRFYYLSRTQGLHFLQELENNAFSKIIMKNTDLGQATVDVDGSGPGTEMGRTHLPGEIFSTPQYIIEWHKSLQNVEDPEHDDELLQALEPKVARDEHLTVDGNTYDRSLKFTGGEHVVLGGTELNDVIIGDLGDDSIWGDGGNDYIEGGHGVNRLHGGTGDDIIYGGGDAEFIHGDEGNDVISAGNGVGDLIFGGAGNDFVLMGEDAKETFAGEGNDFVLGTRDVDALLGGEGDDWLEGGEGFDSISGDNSELFFNSSIIGHDVMFAGTNESDFDAESGDDIMIQGESVMRSEGMIGFDWVSFEEHLFGANMDMNQVFEPTANSTQLDILRNRFDRVEAASGSKFNDAMVGDSRTADVGADPNPNILPNEATLLNDELNAAGMRRIAGLDQLILGGSLAAATLDTAIVFDGGNVLIGGDGSDVLEGRAGDDVIDGDKWLNVRIGINAVINGQTVEIGYAEKMQSEVVIHDQYQGVSVTNSLGRTYTLGSLEGRPLDGLMLDRSINPGDLKIVREIIDSTSQAGNSSVRGHAGDLDIAVFRGSLSEYTFTLADGTVIQGSAENAVTLLTGAGDQRITVAHTGATAALDDGTDVVENIERLQFGDQSIDLVEGLNDRPEPEVVTIHALINNVGQAVFQAGVPMRIATDTTGALLEGFGADRVLDPNNVVGTNTDGAIRNFTVTWQIETAPNSGVYENALNAGGNAVTGLIFTPDPTLLLDGERVRATITYIDGAGIRETIGTGLSTPLDPATGTTILVAPDDEKVVGTHNIPDDGPAGPNASFAAALAAAGTPLSQFGITLGQLGADTLNGGASNGAGGDELYGLSGNDTINGGEGDDLLFGGDGDDQLIGDGSGDGDDNDIIDGGAGNDTAIFNGSNLANYVLEINAENVIEVINNSSTPDPTEDAVLNNVELIRFTRGDDNETNDIVLNRQAVFDAINAIGGEGINVIATAGDDVLAGTPGPDTLDGLAGDDLLFGLAGNDILIGGTGGQGSDILDGGGDFDTARFTDQISDFTLALNAEGRIEVLNNSVNLAAPEEDALINIESIHFTNGNGDPGDDITLNTADVLATLQALAANPLTDPGAINVVPVIVAGVTRTLNGTNAAEVLAGSNNAAVVDVINAGGGDDIVFGLAGNDTLNGGTGDDELRGGTGNDTLNGDAGLDLLFGDAGNDTLNGGADDDELDGGADNDILNGGTGDNVIDGGAGTDTVTFTGLGAVTVDLTAAADQAVGDGTDQLINIENVTGSANGDTITGNGGVNVLLGAGGGDTIDGGGGADTIDGGTGNDTINYTMGDGADTVDGGLNTDVLAITGTGGNDTLDVVFNGTITSVEGGTVNNVERISADLVGGGGDTLSYGATTTAAVTVNLTTGAATGFLTAAGVAAGAISNIENVTGGGGADTLTGSAADNTLNGGAGADAMTGGAGNDTFVVDNAGDTVNEINGVAGGIDTVQSSVNFTLTDPDVENLTLTGTALNATGNTGNNTLTGNGSANVLTGGAGNDAIDGGGGVDRAVFSGSVKDHVIAVTAAGGGAVNGSITATGTNTDGVDTIDGIEQLTFDRGTAATADDITYTSFVFGSNAANNPLNGTGANDIIHGLRGADTINAGVGDDAIIWRADGGAGQTDGRDVINGGTNGTFGDTFIVNGNGQDEIYRIYSNVDTDLITAGNQSAATAAGLTGTGEILVTRNTNGVGGAVTNANIIADLNTIEEIVVNTAAGNDQVIIVGNFNPTNLSQSTITMNGGEGDDVFDITRLTSSHHAVLNSGGGRDRLVGMRSQDEFNVTSSSNSGSGSGGDNGTGGNNTAFTLTPSDVAGLKDIFDGGSYSGDDDFKLGARDLDGSDDGVENDHFIRLTEARFAQDGGINPLFQGLDPRTISNILGAQETDLAKNAAGSNIFFMAFGQYFDHGLDFITKDSSVPKILINGADSFSSTGEPANFLDLTRAKQFGSDKHYQNQTSPYVDQNQAYGSHELVGQFLRESDSNGGFGSHLFAGALDPSSSGQRLLPTFRELLVEHVTKGSVFSVNGGKTLEQYYNADIVDANGNVVASDSLLKAIASDFMGSGHNLLLDANRGVSVLDHYIAGDGRANENITLTSMHTIWARNHNFHVENLEAANFDGTAEQLFQAAKALNEAEYQRVVYTEFADALLGGMRGVGDHGFKEHNPDADGRISLEFAAAVYRVGHSLISDNLKINGQTTDVALKDVFLNPAKYAQFGAGNILGGIAGQQAEEVDFNLVDAVRNDLVGTKADLFAFNVARAWDVGLGTMNQVRKGLLESEDPYVAEARGHAGNLSPYTSWEDFQSRNNLSDAIIAQFRQAYPNLRLNTQAEIEAFEDANPDIEVQTDANGKYVKGIDRVELWVGGLAEKHINGGQVGQTFWVVLHEQFDRLQEADPFYYIDRLDGFDFYEHEFEDTTFADIVARNTGLTGLSENIFQVATNDEDDDDGAGQGGGNDDDNDGAGDGGSNGGDSGTPPTPTHVLFAGTGADDALFGTEGKDSMSGGAGNDTIFGEGGNDNIVAGAGDDEVFAGNGNNVISGGDGADVIFSDEGNDVVLAGTGGDTIDTGAGADKIWGESGDDVITAGAGNDVIFASGRDGNDTINGGDGIDTIDFAAVQTSLTIDLGENGVGFAQTTDSNDVLFDIENVIGGAGNDRITAGGGANVMNGGGGNDTFVFRSAASANGDRIEGFQTGDQIDLTGIFNGGSYSVSPNGTFNATGQVKLTVVNGNTIIEGNTDANNNDAEFSITVAGIFDKNQLF